MPANTENLQPVSPWLRWQVIDSALPVGAFAHSGGLEAAVQFGFVTDAAALDAFARVSLMQTARFAAPFVAATVAGPHEFGRLNRHYDTLLTNDPANRASRALGMAVLAAGDAALPCAGLAATRDAARRGDGFAHYPPAWGLLAAAAGMDAETAVDAMLFAQARSILSAAVRLGVVGPMQAQSMLAALAGVRAECLAVAGQTTPDTAVATAPTLDLVQSLHERLYSRLFNS